MKFIIKQTTLVACLMLIVQYQQVVDAYFESVEPIEQKYETVEENEPLQALSNDQSASQITQQPEQDQQTLSSSNNEPVTAQSGSIVQQQIQHHQLQPQTIAQQSTLTTTLTQSDQNRLNEIYNRLASQAIPKQFQQQQEESQVASASSYSGLSSAGEEIQQSSGEYGMYQPIHAGGNGGLSKITQIPQGSMFAFPDKNGKLEFESMYAKQPYSIVFRTQSMPVKIKQQHQTLPAPEVEFVRSQEEAHRIKHEVIRPVIQEVHEIIQPYRRVVQEVRPVIENVHTIVAKGEPRAQGGQGGGGGNGLKGGGMGGLAGLGLGGGYGGEGIHGSYSENRLRFMSAGDQESAQQQRPQPAPQVQQQSQVQPIQMIPRQPLMSQPTQQHFSQHQPQSRSFRSTSDFRSSKTSGRYLQRRY